MTRVDEINAQIAKLDAERESAMLAERATVLAKQSFHWLHSTQKNEFTTLMKKHPKNITF